MNKREIPVKILNIYFDKIDVKLPFLDVPVSMNYDFFSRRFAEGHFKLSDGDIVKKIRRDLFSLTL